jgi:hypothetical protein
MRDISVYTTAQALTLPPKLLEEEKSLALAEALITSNFLHDSS